MVETNSANVIAMSLEEHSKLTETLERLASENEHLRASLWKIANEDPYNDNGHYFTNMAREAIHSINQQKGNE